MIKKNIILQNLKRHSLSKAEIPKLKFHSFSLSRS